MRNYRPEYVPARAVLRIGQINMACAALVEASRLSAITPMENVRLRFPRIDDGQFARDLSNAQRTAAKLEPKINALAAILRQGERDRDKVTTPRWQAGFDLAIGRALAVKVRTEGYNAMLAEAKQGMKFKNEQSDTWELRPAESVTVSSALAKDADGCAEVSGARRGRAQGNALGTRRDRELRQPFGWEWRRRIHRRRRPHRPGGERPAISPRPERPEPPRKPRRDPPAL